MFNVAIIALSAVVGQASTALDSSAEKVSSDTHGAPTADAAASEASPQAAKSKLAALGISAEGDPQLARTYLDVLVTALGETGVYDIISQNEMNAILGLEKLKDVAGCDQASCMAEIGGALGVERIVTGSVSRVGDATVVSLQLINVKYGNVENRVSMPWTGREGAIVDVIAAAAQSLVFTLAQKKPGSVDVTGAPAGAQIFVDNKPATSHTADLALGPHSLRVSADDYADKTVAFVIKNGAALTLDGTLARISHAPIAAKNLGIAAEMENHFLFDSLAAGQPVWNALVSLEATYRFLRVLRGGLRFGISPASGTFVTHKPWPSAVRPNGGLLAGATFAYSIFYVPNVYDIAVEGGLDLHFRSLQITNFTLPEDFSVYHRGVRKRPFLGGHLAALFDYNVSPQFSLGVVLRGYLVAGTTIVFNGKKEQQSYSAVEASPRLTVRF